MAPKRVRRSNIQPTLFDDDDENQFEENVASPSTQDAAQVFHANNARPSKSEIRKSMMIDTFKTTTLNMPDNIYASQTIDRAAYQCQL